LADKKTHPRTKGAKMMAQTADKAQEELSHPQESTGNSLWVRTPPSTDELRKSFYRNLNIPLRYHGKTLKTLQNCPEAKKAMAAIKTGESLFITGACGTGKTHLAIGLMCAWYAENRGPRGYVDDKAPIFLPAAELFLQLKQSFDGEGEKAVLDRYSLPQLLVIDDIGAEKVSDWSRQVFYTLIDRRYRNMQLTIITSNLSLSDFAARFDDRIVSRLCEMGEVITLKGKDRRLKKP